MKKKKILAFTLPKSLGDALLSLPAARTFHASFTLWGYTQSHEFARALSRWKLTDNGRQWAFAKVRVGKPSRSQKKQIKSAFHPLGASQAPLGVDHERFASSLDAMIDVQHHAVLNLDAAAKVLSKPPPKLSSLRVGIRVNRTERKPKTIALLPDCEDYGKERRWIPKEWAELARILVGDGWTVTILGKHSIVGWHPQARDLTGQTSLYAASKVLAESAAAISIDSGLAHLSSMVGTPTLVLMGPTDERRIAPIGPRVCLLRSKDLACRPCQYQDRFFSCKDRECMSFAAREVVAALQEFLP